MTADMTAEHLLEILKSLRSDGTLDAGSGPLRRRRTPRVGVRQRLTILPLPADAGHPELAPGLTARRGGGRSLAVRIRNVGPRGLGLVVERPLALGGRFLLVLPREMGGFIHLLGVVRRCRRIEGETYDVGVAIRLDVPPSELADHVRSIRDAA